MLEQINAIIEVIDEAVWGLPLIILILFTGFLLTVRLGLLQVRHLGKALKFMVKNEEGGHGEVTSFGALCTALSATIGTGNITGVATAIALGGPGALFWMVVAAFFGMATKYAEGLLAIKYRTIDADGHVLSALTHRDILGSLMGQGVTRERIGDILKYLPGRRVEQVFRNLQKERLNGC